MTSNRSFAGTVGATLGAKSKHNLLVAKAILALAAVPVSAQAVEIVAHRGASHDAPENTLSSVKLGWEQAADAVEIDIRLTQDGQIVLLHDAGTKRTGGPEKDVVEQKFADLRTYDFGGWKDTKFKGEKIPTLDEVLATIPAGKKMLVEIKCGPEIVPGLVQAVKRSGKTAEQIVLIGFSLPTMQAAKQALPEHQVYWLSSFKKDAAAGAFTPSIDELITQAKAAGMDGLDLKHTGPITAENVRKIKAAGLQCHVWTVDKPEDARRCIEAGVDSITTNRPAFLRDVVLAKK